MINTRDICYRMDISVVPQNFWELNTEGKKNLIDSELKKYILSKLELNVTKNISEKNNEEVTVYDLINILANNIPKEEHLGTIDQFTHYILKMVGTLQGFDVIWWVEEEEYLIENPKIDIRSDGRWDQVITHKETDYVKSFSHVYYSFINGFMVKNNKSKEFSIKLPDNKEIN
jgi:hypothetical protein